MIADRLGVAGRSRAHRLVVSGLGIPAGIAGDGAGDAFHMLEHALHAPKAPTREDRNLRGRSGPGRLVHGGRGYDDGAFSLCGRSKMSARRP